MTARALVALLALLPAPLAAQSPDRTAPPPLGPPPDFAPPPIERLALGDGLEVLLLEKPQVPLVQVDLVVRAGSVDDPEGKKGLAGMTAAMLDEGAGERDALELAEAVELLGAFLSTGAGHHTSAIRLHVPAARLEPALALMADVVLRPAFPTEELERQRKARLTTLLQWRDEPDAIAAVELADQLYGDAHAYGTPTLGTAAGLAALTVDDLRAFHEARYRSGHATLIVVGDMTRESVIPLLERAFAGWSVEPGEPDTTTMIEQVGARRIVIVDKPGAPQSEIRVGRIGVPRLSEDYYAIEVMNTILGGSFSARLNKNLREDKGYTYGAFSYFDYRPEPGPFVALAAVQTEVTDRALVEFMKELRGILERVSEEELAGAKNYLALGFPQSFQTVAGTAGMLGELAVHGLPLDSYDHYVERIQAVTVEDVYRVAHAYLDPERVVIVVVGDRATIEAPIRALDLGPVEVLTVEDALGPPPDLASSP